MRERERQIHPLTHLAEDLNLNRDRLRRRDSFLEFLQFLLHLRMQARGLLYFHDYGLDGMQFHAPGTYEEEEDTWTNSVSALVYLLAKSQYTEYY
jgi:hypothetical protein